jgi:NADPH:quinone reductase-like Zn-dependent oxidoreductase
MEQLHVAIVTLGILAGASFMVGQTRPAPPAATPPTMKAVRIHSTGGIDVLKYETAPRPEPKDNELLIHVMAAGVNPVDAKLRSGQFGRTLEGKFPFILGWDIAGVVEKVGGKVTKFKPGDAAYAFLSLTRGGGYAEYATALEVEASAKPASLSFEQAAAVPLAALTAWQALIDAGKLEKGQTALIHGGSGGVGSFAVQIAKSRGARVYATASTANQDLLKDLGADVAIDYTKTKFEDVAKDVDIVLDTVGGNTTTRSIEVLKRGGILVSIVGHAGDPLVLKEKGVRGTTVLVKPNADELAEITKLIEDKKMKVVLSKVLPLADAAQAHELIATGHTRGKIVLKTGREP